MKYKVKKSFNLWLTGFPCSGKTTTAVALKEMFDEMQIPIVHLDGDVVRKGLCSDLGFGKEDREENNRRIIHISEIIVSSGIPVITTFISPYKTTREFARTVIPNFILVFIDTPLEVCMQRDVKGMYKKAQAGEIKNFTGVDDIYEKPEDPELVIPTEGHTVEENLEMIIKYLLENDYLEEIN